MSTPLSREMVERALPANLKANATQAFTDQINQIVSDPLIAEQVRENFISYSGVLKDGKFKTQDYLHAVVFASHKLMGDSNHDAYFKTFPGRYQELLAAGRSSKEISSYVSAYAKGKLVNLIIEQTLVPAWILNQEAYQKAINVQVELMTDDQISPKVRSDAANSILTHLAKPKEVGPLINIDAREASGMAELRSMLEKVAQQQVEAIKAGASTRDIAAQKIIDQEGNDVAEANYVSPGSAAAAGAP